MKIRAQLIAAFIVFAVVPLALIVLYSYRSSQQAVLRAMEDEAQRLAADMHGAMVQVKEDFGRRFARLDALPFQKLLNLPEGDGAATATDLVEQILAEMGPTTRFVESLELIPAAPGAPFTLDVRETLGGEGSRLDRKIFIGPDARKQPVLIELGSFEALQEAQALELDRPSRDAAIGRLYAERVDSLRRKDPEAIREHEELRRKTKLLFGGELGVPVLEDGRLIGRVVPQIRVASLLAAVLTRADRAAGEVPFAIDAEGEVYFADELAEKELAVLDLRRADLLAARGRGPHAVHKHAVLATETDKISGVTYGIVRPIRESLAQIRSTAFANLLLGLVVIGVALWAIVPLSGRMAGDVEVVTDAAERIAAGDLEARVQVRSKNEIGQLATAFNRMAVELRQNQQRLLDEERRRREQEMRQHLLEAENSRKSAELEAARELQLSLLPKALPEHPLWEIHAEMRTATEVGGDYYDLCLVPGDPHPDLTVVLGDATGHGARAGTMVTVAKSLFVVDAGERSPAELLQRWGRTIRDLELGRMAMAMVVARFAGRRLTLASAGMPPVLIRRVGGEVEEIAIPGMPLGSRLETESREVTVELAPGDVVLLLSDGLPELPDRSGEPLGYPAVRDCLASSVGGAPRRLINALLGMAAKHRGGPPEDDMTFVVVRARA